MNATNTSIEWVLNPDNETLGKTWNPITGCLNGCPYCYARKLANGRLRSRYLANTILPCHDEPNHEKHHSDPFYPRFWPGRMEELAKRNALIHKKGFSIKPIGIFAVDMGDLFGVGIPEKWTSDVLDLISDNGYDRFYLLTHQPQNLTKWSPFPDNCWVGVTATNAKMAEEAGFWLWEVKAKLNFVSFEPLLERIPTHFADYISEEVEGIKWVIIGGKSGKDKFYPPEEWIQEIESAADKAGIPVFEKNNLRKVWNRPARQEMPTK